MTEKELKRSFPLLSIIIPVFNNLEGIIPIYNKLSKYKNIELIIIDDGSNNENRINPSNFDLCKVINQKNSGVSKARNLGIKYCAGEYLTFLDSDDDIIGIETILNYLIGVKDQNTLIFFPMIKLFPNGNTELSFAQDLNYKGYVGGKVVNRKFFMELDLRFNEKLKICEDSLFWAEILIKSKNIIWVNDAKYLYHQNKNDEITFEKIFQILIVIFNLLPKLVYSTSNKNLIKQDLVGMIYYFLIVVKSKLYAK
jgi:glycosyltransferase involved in cell wall biosynthesis